MGGLKLAYQQDARHLLQGKIQLFLGGPQPPSDANILAHPPGYPIFMAMVWRVFGDSETVVQFLQIICEAIAATFLFLIALELLPVSVAITAAMLVAHSPQLSFNSLLLLPDSLVALTILAGMYALIRARKRPHLTRVIMAGGLIGVSCWLRANGLLLAMWLILIISLTFERGRRMRDALVMVGAMLVVIAPITIRNAIVFHHFIPLSLGSGITFMQGIGDYDPEGRFGLPATDVGVGQMEIAMYGRPDYTSLYAPDGIKRDRDRLARSMSVIRSHPFWFFGVTFRRAASMLRYDRVPLISAMPTVTRPLNTEAVRPVWTLSPAELQAHGTVPSSQTELALTADGQRLRLAGDDSVWGDQIISAPVAVQENTEYVLEFPVKVEQGRSFYKVVDASSGTLLSSIIMPNPWASVGTGEQSMTVVQLPFVSSSTNQVCIVLSNNDSHGVRPITQLGEMKLFILGESSYIWTRYPRAVIRFLQKFFLTAWMLPLFIFGILILIGQREVKTLVILLAVPSYYLCVQSPLHTESRYVLTMQYFNFIFIAVALCWIGKKLWQVTWRLRRMP